MANLALECRDAKRSVIEGLDAILDDFNRVTHESNGSNP